MSCIPSPDVIFPNEYKTSCFIKNVVTAPNITIGDYTYYDDVNDPTGFEKNNVLFNYPEFGDLLIIGKFCMLAQGTKFIMAPRITASQASQPIPSTSSAARGRKTPHRTWTGYLVRVISCSETTCGSGTRASSCPASRSATVRSSRPTLSL